MRTYHITGKIDGKEINLGDTKTYSDARRRIGLYLKNVKSVKKVIESTYYDKYLINGKEFWIDWSQ